MGGARVGASTVIGTGAAGGGGTRPEEVVEVALTRDDVVASTTGRAAVFAVGGLVAGGGGGGGGAVVAVAVLAEVELDVTAIVVVATAVAAIAVPTAFAAFGTPLASFTVEGVVTFARPPAVPGRALAPTPPAVGTALPSLGTLAGTRGGDDGVPTPNVKSLEGARGLALPAAEVDACRGSSSGGRPNASAALKKNIGLPESVVTVWTGAPRASSTTSSYVTGGMV